MKRRLTIPRGYTYRATDKLPAEYSAENLADHGSAMADAFGWCPHCMADLPAGCSHAPECPLAKQGAA
jgi:hypothetical protein